MTQVVGTVTGNDSVAVIGTASQGERTLGVRGQGDSSGVQGIGIAWNGVEGISTSTIGGAGVFGANDTGVGVRGESKETYNPAIQGIHRGEGGAGVQGESENFVGVIGVTGRESQHSVGVYGEAAGNLGVYPPVPVGVWGNSKVGIGIFGSGGSLAGDFWGNVRVRNGSLECGRGDGYSTAGTFNGHVDVRGGLVVNDDLRVFGRITKGSGGFKIDHPLDPTRKYLCHSFVESPDMKNLYDGVVVLNANGEAVIKLPSWFEALNQDFRYQLTPLGAPAPDLHIAEGIRKNRFKIAGGKRGTKVSWQVTGVRRDAFAKAYRMPVEETKGKGEQGLYAHPEAHGQPLEKGIVGLRSAVEKKRLKELQKATQAAEKELKPLKEIARRPRLSRKSRTARK